MKGEDHPPGYYDSTDQSAHMLPKGDPSAVQHQQPMLPLGDVAQAGPGGAYAVAGPGQVQTQGGPPGQQHTTVVIQQPGGMVGAGGNTVITTVSGGAMASQRRDWSSGLCACCDDCESCICAYFCYSCYLCHLYGRYGEFVCTPCCVPGSDLILRVMHRSRFNIQGSVIDDCCKVVCCGPCTMCQLKRDFDFIEEQGMTLRG